MTEGSHTGIYCDECGAYPIRGTRFKSLRVYDYDICCDCRYYNYARDSPDFLAYDSPITKLEANQVGPAIINRIDAQSARDAEEQLRKGRNAHVAFFAFFGSSHEEGDRQAVVDFINRNPHLTNIHIRLYSFQNHQEVFSTMTEGLLHNKSVKHLCWHLIPLHNQGSFLDPTPLKALIEQNNTLEALFITRSKNWSGSAIGENTPRLENEFARSLFESLLSNKTIKSFRLETVTNLSQSTKELTWDVVRCNSALTRFHANFETQDNQLKMLLAFNQFKWMNRWTDTFATPPSRLEIVKEIVDCDSAKDASSLYYLLRAFPEALGTMA
jgi:hypothetical protein